MIRWLLVAVTLLFVGIEGGANNQVLLRDVTAITLTEGARTNGRRSSGVPQLTCVGGSARGQVQHPSIVQCKNVGFDGSDVQWECKAELDTRVRFGRINVNCEGYNYPEDPYVLRGSCGLEYELEWKSASDRAAAGKGSGTSFETFLTGVAILFIVAVLIYMVYSAANGEPTNPDPPGFRRFGTGFDNGPGGPPGGGGGGHPGYPGSGPPPKYDDCFDGKGTSSRTYASSSTAGGRGGARQANDGPGFWTGAGLGALGGYFMGRQQANDGMGTGARYRGGFNQGSSGHDYNYDQPGTSYGSSSSSSSRSQPTQRSTSTGYGGTTRR